MSFLNAKKTNQLEQQPGDLLPGSRYLEGFFFFYLFLFFRCGHHTRSDELAWNQPTKAPAEGLSKVLHTLGRGFFSLSLSLPIRVVS